MGIYSKYYGFFISWYLKLNPLTRTREALSIGSVETQTPKPHDLEPQHHRKRCRKVGASNSYNRVFGS